MEVILDTSFIFTCLKEKLDFLEVREYGDLILPRQVILELEKLSKKKKGKDNENALLALEIIKKNKDKFKIVLLEGKYADSGIRKYIKENEGGVILATFDRELKKGVGEVKILTIRGKKKFSLE